MTEDEQWEAYQKFKEYFHKIYWEPKINTPWNNAAVKIFMGFGFLFIGIILSFLLFHR